MDRQRYEGFLDGAKRNPKTVQGHIKAILSEHPEGMNEETLRAAVEVRMELNAYELDRFIEACWAQTDKGDTAP